MGGSALVNAPFKLVRYKSMRTKTAAAVNNLRNFDPNAGVARTSMSIRYGTDAPMLIAAA